MIKIIRIVMCALILLNPVLVLADDTVGVILGSQISTGNPANTYPAAVANQIKGGRHTVADITARNAITTERRTIGMEVFVAADGITYELIGGITNSNWQVQGSQIPTGWTDSGTNVSTTTSTDKVGIGTSVPSSSLHVHGGSIKGELMNKGWEVIPQDPNMNPSGVTFSEVNSMTVMDGELYIGYDIDGSAGVIRSPVYKWDGQKLTFMSNIGSTGHLFNGVAFLIEYQGKLYAGLQSNTPGEGDVYVSTDKAQTWTKVFDGGSQFAYSAAVFKGKLYVGSGYNNPGEIYVFDGTTWSTAYAGYATAGLVTSLHVSKGRLFAALGGTDSLIISTDDGSTWLEEILDTSYSEFNHFVDFKGRLFANVIAGSNDILVRDDATRTWSVAYDDLPGNQCWGMNVYNDVLYVGCSQSPNGAIIFKSKDGYTYENEIQFNTLGTDYEYEAFKMINYNGSMYVGMGGDGLYSANLYRKTDSLGQLFDTDHKVVSNFNFTRSGTNWSDQSLLEANIPISFKENVSIGTNSIGTAKLNVVGNVGIGSTTPQRPLDVNTSSVNVARFISRAASGAGAGTANIRFGTDDGAALSADDKFVTLDFFGSKDSLGGHGSSAGITAYALSNWSGTNYHSRMDFETTNKDSIVRAVRMTIANGNVGIGSTNPSQKLDVFGVVKASSFVGDGSSLTNLPTGSGLNWSDYSAITSVNSASKFLVNNSGTNNSIDLKDVQDSLPFFRNSLGAVEFNPNNREAIKVPTSNETSIYDPDTTNAPFTFGTWAYARSNGRSGLGELIQKGIGDNTGKGYHMHLYAGNSSTAKIGTNVGHNDVDGDKATAADGAASGSFPLNQPVFAVATYNEDVDKRMKTYVQGSEISYASNTPGTGNVSDDSALDLFIGNKKDGSVTFDGYLWGTFICKGHAMSAAEVAEAYKGYFPPGCVTAKYDFSEGRGQYVKEFYGGPAGRTGTIASSVFTPADLPWIVPSRSFAGGNFGIGTSTPLAQAHIVNVGSGPTLLIYDQAQDVSPTTIDATGNFGIATIAPTSKLQVVGTVTATAFVGDGSGLTNLPDSSSGWTDGGSNVYASDTADSVGIGTTAANGATLEVVKNASQPALKISSSASGNGDYLTVTSSGAVGIGTTNPLATNNQWYAMLHKDANALREFVVKNPNAGTSAGAGFETVTADTNGYFRSYPTNFSIASFAGKTVVNNEAGEGLILNVPSAKTIQFIQSATERARIATNGNFGIATIAPTSKLQVVGTVTATAFVGDGSGLTNLPGGGSITIGTTSPMTGAGSGTSFTLGINQALMTLSSIGGAVTDAQVPNNITIDNATTAANLGADGVDALTEIAQSIKTAANDTSAIVVGTPGATNDCAKWDASGALVSAGAACGTSGGGINNVVEDTTPELGGNLDVNGKTITSASNGNIIITPNGTGRVGIGTVGPTQSLQVVGTIAATAFTGDGSGLTAVGASALATDSVSADELNATGVEAELEAAMDLQDMQGAVTDAQVPNTITVDLATTATTATLGDSATAFFSSGQIERARGGTAADTSGYGAGILGSDGSNNTIDIDTIAEIETAIGGATDIITSSEINASSEIRSILTDETGTGALVFAGGAIGAATATTPAEDDNDTSVATTAYVQTEIAGLTSWADGGSSVYVATTSDNVAIGTITPTNKLTVAGTVSATAFVGDGSGLTGISGGSSGWTDGGTNVYVSTTTDTVGIGTTGVSGKMLQIKAPEADVQFYSTGVGGYSELELNNSTGAAGGFGIMASNDSNAGAVYMSSFSSAQPLLFRPNDATAMAIIPGGNVGINTVAPTAKLQVVGTVKATAFVGDGSGLTGISGTASGWTDGGTNIYPTLTSDRVAIGTTTPVGTNALTVVGGIGGSGTGPMTFTGANVGIGTTTAPALFTVGSTGSFQVDTSGNTRVGIGTTTAGTIVCVKSISSGAAVLGYCTGSLTNSICGTCN